MRKHALLSARLVFVGSLILALCLPAQSFAAATKETNPSPARTAPKAEFNWKMRAGEKLRVAMVTQPWSEFINKFIPEFKSATGIDVTYEILPEDQFRQKTTVEFAAGTSDVDAFLSMVAQEGIKYESAGWYADVETFLKDQKITDPNFDFKDFTRSAPCSTTRNSLTRPASNTRPGPPRMWRRQRRQSTNRVKGSMVSWGGARAPQRRRSSRHSCTVSAATG